jgi:hypothetical protein
VDPAVPLAELPEPLVELPVEPPIDPLVSVPVADPDDPACDGSFDGSFDGSVAVELLEPEEPDPIVDPLDPDCAAAGIPAKSSPAVPRPATQPHPIFMRLPPLLLLRSRRPRHPCRGSSCWRPIR